MDNPKKLIQIKTDNKNEFIDQMQTIFNSKKNSIINIILFYLQDINKIDNYKTYHSYNLLNKVINKIDKFYKASTVNKLRSDINLILKSNNKIYESQVYKKHIKRVFNNDITKKLSEEYRERVRSNTIKEKISIKFKDVETYIYDNCNLDITDDKSYLKVRTAICLACSMRWVESVGFDNFKFKSESNKPNIITIKYLKKQNGKSFKPFDRHIMMGQYTLLKQLNELQKYNFKDHRNQKVNRFMRKHMSFIPKEVCTVKYLRPIGVLASAYKFKQKDTPLIAYVNDELAHTSLDTTESYISRLEVV